MEIATIREKLRDKRSERAIHKDNITRLNKELDVLFTSTAGHIKARELMQKAAELTQKNLEEHLSKITTKALDIVFEEEAPLFIVRFISRRNVSECDMFFSDDGVNEMNPLDSCGFGAVDVASFALRVSIWALSETRNCLIIDEPFRNLDEERMPRASQMLKILSDELQIQMIVVTHETYLEDAADKVFVVTKKNKISSVKEK